MQKKVKIDDIEYPIQVVGTGRIPCLCIGLGNLLLRSLSDEFKKLFTVYSTDLYFIAQYQHPSRQSLTMQVLAEHILKVIDQLKLDKLVIIAHSCFGILAMEVAKQNQSKLRGLILVASAPQWNKSSIEQTEQYFMEHAEPERIENDRARKQKYALIRKPADSEVSIEKYIADSARYWGNYDITDEEIYRLWEGIEIDDAVINQFFEIILPQYDLSQGIENVTIPILLLAGECDYDSLPLVQWKNYPHPSSLTIVNCGNVGHWPQLENQAIFDVQVAQWLQTIDIGAMKHT